MRIQIVSGAKQGFLDISGDTPAMINFNNNDIKDVTKLSGSYTSTLKIVNNKSAQEILGHIFNVSVTAQNGVFFDARKKVKCVLVEDGTVFKEDLNLQLKEVAISEFSIVSYSVELYDDKAELFNDLSNKLLVDLDFSDGDHTLSPDLIQSTFNKTSSNSIFKYHLTTNNGNNYALNQFKPAIWASEYVKRIGQTNGFELTVQDSDKVQFKNMIVPCTRQTINTGSEPVVIQKRDTSTGFYERFNDQAQPYQTFGNLGAQIVFNIQEFDPNNQYNDGSGAFVPFTNFPAGNAINFKIDYEIELSIENTLDVELYQFGYALPDRLKTRFTLRKNPNPHAFVYSGDELVIPEDVTLSPLETKIVATGTGSVTFGAGNMLTTESFYQYFAVAYSQKYKSWRETSDGVERKVKFKARILNAKITISANVDGGFYLGNRVRLNNFIPDKAKQVDLIKTIATLNNMWLIKEDEKKFKLIRRAEYLKAGKRKDWSDKINNDSYTLSDISELTNKSMKFSYKQDKDALNTAYADVTGETYGQFEFIFESEHVRGEKKNEVAFASTPVHETNFGAIVPALNGIEPKHEPRLLLDGGVFNCGAYNITVQGLPNYQLTSYPHVSHLDHPTAPTLDLNFGVAQYYFYPQGRLTQNNMFNLNWRNVMYTINKGRILKALFNLSIVDIHNFEFNDRIFCMGQWWHVNTMKANLNRKVGEANYLAQVELIPADEDDEVKTVVGGIGGTRPPIVRPIKDTFPFPIVSAVNDAISTTIKGVVSGKNVFLGNGIFEVYGEGNIILGGVTKAVVFGDNMTITENGIHTKNLSILENGQIKVNFSMMDGGKDNVLSLGGQNTIKFSMMDGGKDNVLSLGGTKDFQMMDGGQDEII